MFNTNHPIYTNIKQHLSKLTADSIVIDAGTSKRFAKEIGLYRQRLESVNYYALGYQPTSAFGKDKCDVGGSILEMPFRSESVDAIFCFEVIEHVPLPQQAVNETRRCLKKGGMLVLTTPFLTPYHGRSNKFNDYSHQSYPDFWRFTHQGLQLLCKNYSSTTIIPFDNTLEFYIQKIIPFMSYRWGRGISDLLRKALPPRLGNPTDRHLVIAIK